jgi:hypothetical protein
MEIVVAEENNDGKCYCPSADEPIAGVPYATSFYVPAEGLRQH